MCVRACVHVCACVSARVCVCARDIPKYFKKQIVILVQHMILGTHTRTYAHARLFELLYTGAIFR